MKKRILTIIVLCICLGCSRGNELFQSNNSSSVSYYFTSNNKLFEYSNDTGIIEVGIDDTKSVASISNSEIQVATNSSFNIISYSGIIEFHYEPNDEIEVATMDTDLMDEIYYINSNRELKKYSRVDKTIEIVMENIFPIPEQMVVDSSTSILYYHTKRNIIKLDLNTLKAEKLLEENFPIQSIAVCNKTKNIHFSSSIDGRIYIYYASTGNTQLFHHVMSAAGSSIWLDENEDELYFSRSNGMNIEIKKINTNTKSTTDLMTLYNMNYIDNLVIKSNDLI